jgi:hypothetical protein
MGTDIYLVITKDRHADTRADAFAGEQAAIDFARQVVALNARHPDLITPADRVVTPAMSGAGWIWYCRYSSEGDEVRVERSELKGGEVIADAELAALRSPEIQEAIAAARLAGPGGFRPRSRPGPLPEQQQYPDVTHLRWAPYQEFGIPLFANKTREAPAGPVTIMATGYRENLIIIYWVPAWRDLRQPEEVAVLEDADVARLGEWLAAPPAPGTHFRAGPFRFEAAEGGGIIVKARRA